jgi:hypothetical protein
MGNPFICSSLDGSGLVFFLLIIGWLVLSIVIGIVVNYLGRSVTNTNFNTVVSLLLMVNVSLLVFGIIVNSFSYPCGGNIFAVLCACINIYLLYTMFCNHWKVAYPPYSDYSGI